MIELYQRFGDVLYFEIISELLERNRRAIASIIQGMPEEPAYFEDWIDDDGQGVGPWKIACTMTKKGKKLDFDFSGTDPQAPSSINFYLSIAMFVAPCISICRLYANQMSSMTGSRCLLASICLSCSKHRSLLRFNFVP